MCKSILDAYIEELPIRKVSISLGKLSDNNYVQLNLFDTNEESYDETMKTIDEITKRFGDNAILKASSLLDYSTIKMRNKKMGGHNK